MTLPYGEYLLECVDSPRQAAYPVFRQLNAWHREITVVCDPPWRGPSQTFGEGPMPVYRLSGKVCPAPRWKEFLFARLVSVTSDSVVDALIGHSGRFTLTHHRMGRYRLWIVNESGVLADQGFEFDPMNTDLTTTIKLAAGCKDK